MHYHLSRQKLYLKFFKVKLFVKNHRFLFVPIWLTSTLTLVVVMATLVLTTTTVQKNQAVTYSIFSAKPQILGAATVKIEPEDARVEALTKTFKNFNCPITPHAKKFVTEADANNIPFWLVASIAFQESSCGKNVPTVAGESSNNLYGWGVWGPHIKTFANIDEGIKTVSAYMSKRFYTQGINDLCEIMKVYTPPSKGSWCQGVGFFRDKILDHYKQ